MKAYNSQEDMPMTPEEKRRITSFHAIWIEFSAEIELIMNIINTSRIQFLSLLDIVSNTNHDKYIDSQYPERLKRSVLGTVFPWLYGRLGGTGQNIEQLKAM